MSGPGWVKKNLISVSLHQVSNQEITERSEEIFEKPEKVKIFV
jgi:hypothetical protein